MSTLSNAAAPGPDSHDMYQRIGALTRNLHDALQQLGYDKDIAASLGNLPDARERLSFIARLTGEAAEKVLNTVDAAQAQQQALLVQAALVEERLGRESPGAGADYLLDFIGLVKASALQTSGQLSDIMLAQDFHDLTGQTVRKVVEVAATLEQSLLKLLLESTPPGPPPRAASGGLEGPVANPAMRSNVVNSQAQVDDLLASLDF